MSGNSIISPRTYWYHQVGGHTRVYITSFISPSDADVNAAILSKNDLLSFINDAESGNISYFNESIRLYDAEFVNDTEGMYGIDTNGTKYVLVYNNEAGREIRIDYNIGPVLRKDLALNRTPV